MIETILCVVAGIWVISYVLFDDDEPPPPSAWH